MGPDDDGRCWEGGREVLVGGEDVTVGCCSGGGSSVLMGVVLVPGFAAWEIGVGWRGEVAVA